MSYSSITVVYKVCSLVLGAQSKFNLCFCFSFVKCFTQFFIHLVLWALKNSNFFFYFNKSFALWIINMLYNAALKLNEILAAQEVLVKWGNLLTTVVRHLENWNKMHNYNTRYHYSFIALYNNAVQYTTGVFLLQFNLVFMAIWPSPHAAWSV